MTTRPKNPIIAKLVDLLRGEAADKQIAAAIVLGELDVRDPAATEALLALLDSHLGPLQRHALEALTHMGAKAILPKAVALLGARDQALRAAALAAVVAAGDAAVPAVRARLGGAVGDERRALEDALAHLGGKDAFSALLGNLGGDDAQAVRAGTLALRQHVKETAPGQRKAYLGQVMKFLGAKSTLASPAALAAGVKILGFLEQEASVKTLLGYATDGKQADAVREEALIALRFAARGETAAALGAALLGVAETASPALARAALFTLAGAEVAPALAARLGKLAAHPDGTRALLAIERLAQLPSAGAADALGKLLLATGERVRAEAAASALAAHADAGPALARALLAAPDGDRASMLARLLRPHAPKLGAKILRPILDAGLKRIRDDDPPWEPYLQVSRDGDAQATAAGLRALAAALRKSKQPARALVPLRLLGGSAEAAPEDGYALATLELAAGRRDEAFLIFGQLSDRGFDVAAALRGDRALDPEQRYQIGFYFAERRHPLGEEILTAVAEAGGRSKTAQMARAKLKSAGLTRE